MSYNRASAEIIHGFIIRKYSSSGLCAERIHRFIEVLRIVAKTPLVDYVQVSAEIIHGFIEVLRIVAKTPLVDYVRVSAEITHAFIKDAYIRKHSCSGLGADIRRNNV